MERGMRQMLAIYKRELKSYFQSMVGCVFIAFLMVFTGIYFMAYNLTAGYPYFSYTLSGSLIVFIVGIPLITMRSFSEERKNKTDQLLLTAPVSLGKVVMGKYLAMATVIAIPNVIFCLYPLIIKSQGTAYLTVDYISILVFFLLGCVYAAIGMFMSSLTESQIIAFISTFGILLVLYLWDGILSMLPSSAISGLVGVLILLTVIAFYIWHMTANYVIAAAVEIIGIVAGVVVYIVDSSLYENLLSNLLGRLALANVFTDIATNNIVDVTGIIFYLSIIAVFVFLTVQSIQKRRWS
ncbi:MAG TPA: ABC transporter [Candidatus Mediterraneibacter norfolkensis]|nr:ABC transporter [Candidatus Mediterraneibacter norfolkensis]